LAVGNAADIPRTLEDQAMFRAGTERRAPASHRGLSIMEFIGCLSAMVGGLFLGSLYLGVDCKEMAYTALEQAQVIEPRVRTSSPAEAPTAQAELATAEAAGTDAAPTSEQTSAAPAEASATAATSAAEVAPTAEQATGETVAETPAPQATAQGFFAREDLLTDAQREALTLEYWTALDACMADEVKSRVPAIDRDGNWQLFDYLTGRKDGHVSAAAAIAALDVRGVDDHVLAYAKKARAWHDSGAKLFGRAVDLLTDAPTAQLSGPFAQSWQSAATQHRMEERLLGEKHLAVESYLRNTYVPQPATAAAPATPVGG
jgi:hypothetical protein